MSLIEFELKEVRKLCGNVIESSQLVTCDESLVSPHFFQLTVSLFSKSICVDFQIRVNINQTKCRCLTACLRFPKEDYPHQPLLVELKSKTLGDRILENLTKSCDEHCKTSLLDKPQILPLLKFLVKTLQENPLCICYDEIINLKQFIAKTEINTTLTKGTEIKVKQKKSAISLRVCGGKYFIKLEVTIPADYPHERPEWQDFHSNFPDVLIRYLNGQAKETVRLCVEPPLRVFKNDPPWAVQPSLYKTFKFLIQATQEFHTEICQVCRKKCLPEDPEEIVKNDNDDLYVERAFCGHIYHSGCLKKYFCTPPFPSGGKLCLASSKHSRPDYIGLAAPNTKSKDGKSGNKSIVKQETNEGCGQRLMHDKWALDPKKAEQRWAHKKARERELEEVVDFLK